MHGGATDSAQGGPFAEEVSEWAAETLAPYINRFPERAVNAPKQIHDPIGNVIRLEPWEVYVLDSPLVQRLRYIRQLGVGHYLFPSAGYSRFEHSLGTLEAATQLFDAVTSPLQNTELPNNPSLKDTMRGVVRLAALLHDMGHCVFSHVSERFYTSHPGLVDAVRRMRSHYENKVTPAEALSILIIRSKPFIDLLRRARLGRMEEWDEIRIVDIVCACIAGSKKRTAPYCFLAEIVNGPVDADKLDYLARDAHMVRVPILLDISRLLSRLRLARSKGDNDEALYSLAILPSAARALEELLVTRIFLYDKFYYHPKIMAAEEMLRRGLSRLAAAIKEFQSPITLLRYGDDEFLSLTPHRLAAAYEISSGDVNVIGACAALAEAKLRWLPKRAFAFARRFLPELPEVLARLEFEGKSDPVNRGLSEFITESRFLDSYESQRLAADAIQALSKEIRSDVDVDVFVGLPVCTEGIRQHLSAGADARWRCRAEAEFSL